MDDTAARWLRCEHVSVAYGADQAVDDVSLAIRPGEAVAILGPSGCGKTTLLRVLAGLEAGYTGRVTFRDSDLRGVPPHRRRFAMVFQDGQLFEHLSVARNIGYGLAGTGLTRGERRERVTGLLDLVGLAGFGARRPATLSGGERQRVALARALAPRPEILLLDEPLSALDRSLRERLAADLRGIITATGTTTVLVTHDHDEALTIGDRVAVMRSGRIVQAGPGAQVWRHPADEETARFLGCGRVLRGAPARAVLHAVGRAPDAGAGDPRVALRRSAFRVEAGGLFAGTVRSVAAAAEALRLTVDVEGIGPVEALGDIAAGTTAGDAVRLVADLSGLAFLPPR